MKMRIQRMQLHKWALASVASGAMMFALAQAQPAQAFEFEMNGITGSFDTTLAAGATFRVAKRDPRLIAAGNGGTGTSANGDDGNLNYGRGLVAASVRATHELELAYENLGAFTRFNYFYDFKNADGDTDFRDLPEASKKRVGRDFSLLDAYVYGNFDVADHPVYLSGGKQVLSWGESTFIQNGINVINPIDVSAIRVPGSELRDALVPIPMVRTDVGVTDNLNVEGFYQLQWQKTEPDASGTFFSSNDFISPGGSRVLLGFGAIGDATADAVAGLDPTTLGLLSLPTTGVVVPRIRDDKPSHHGQYGLGLRYFAEELNQTEFGLFFINHHSRLPVASGRSGSTADLVGADAPNFAAGSGVIVTYPEDIKLFGGSFSTEIGTTGVALQGEYSFRKDQPLQVDDVEVLFATLAPAVLAGAGCLDVGTALAGPCQGAIAILNENQIISRRGPLPTAGGGATAPETVGAVASLFDSTVDGFERFDVSQAQFTLTKLLGPMLGAGQVAVVGEVGGTFIHGMPSKGSLRLEGPGTGLGGNDVYTPLGLIPAGTDPDSMFADRFSWGYQLVIAPTYNGLLGPVNVNPRIAFQHDVGGITPAPLGNFVEGRKAITLGIGFDNIEALIKRPWSHDSITADISYTNFFGAGRGNVINDRDFVAMNIRYSF